LTTKYTVSRDGTDPNAAGNHRKNLTLSLETSLRRLRTDYIDLYWVHLWDRHTPGGHWTTPCAPGRGPAGSGRRPLTLDVTDAQGIARADAGVPLTRPP
jgi:hypothetical protein